MPLPENKIIGICLHGLMGNVYSKGVDALAAKLNKVTPENVHFDVMGGDNPDTIVDQIAQHLIIQAGLGNPPILIGHSFGADDSINISDKLNAAGAMVPLLVTLDPTCWRTNRQHPGIWGIPSNVVRALNFRQDIYPGGGHIIAEGGGTLVSEKTFTYPHADLGLALAMDSAQDIHASVIAAVLATI